MDDALALTVPTLAQQPLWMYYLPGLAFAFCFGACVGSFLNVVAYRLPAGISIISPPSRCPTCGAKLSWKENFPILGWLALRGQCKHCRVRISPQYMFVEVFVACLFLALAVLFYVVRPSAEWWGHVAGTWWYANGFFRTWPAFIAILVMFSGLVAMTLVDARTFTIPIEIPATVTIVAFAAHLLQGVLSDTPKVWPAPMGGAGPLPQVDAAWAFAAAMGMLGLMISWMLLRRGVLRYSFADYNDYLPKTPAGEEPPPAHVAALDLLFAVPPMGGVIAGGFFGLKGGLIVFAVTAVGLSAAVMIAGWRGANVAGPDASQTLAPDYPHARREMLVEIAYVAPAVVLMVAGLFVGRAMFGASMPPSWLQGLAGSAFGYIVGGGVVWTVRILGTLGFGREAIGMGDVHLLAAVGATLGWIDPIFVFFAAAVIAIQWVLVTLPAKVLVKGVRRELPLGPHLAAATLVVLLLHPVLYHGPNWWGRIVTACQVLATGSH
jgi:leader peptidase (prepilin peptidase)/N-methyltransferase